jgi:hypothetical protein
MKTQIVLCCAIVLALASCKKENVNDGGITEPRAEVLVLNSGAESDPASSISMILSNDDVTLDQFQKANGNPLQHTLSDIQVQGDFAYALSKEAGKLIIMNPSTCEQIGEISGLTAARNLYIKDATTAFVTAGTDVGLIFKLDLTDRSIVGVASVSGLPNEMIHVDDRLLVSCGRRLMTVQATIEVVDINTMMVVESTSVDRVARGWVKDYAGMLWQLREGYSVSSGSCDGAIPYAARLVSINPMTLETTTYEIFDPYEQYPTSLSISPDGKTLYFLNDGLRSVDLTTTIDDHSVLNVPCASYTINHAKGEIWITQTEEDQGVNKVGQYNLAGQLLQEFNTGVNPTDIVLIH